MVYIALFYLNHPVKREPQIHVNKNDESFTQYVRVTKVEQNCRKQEANDRPRRNFMHKHCPQ